MRMLGFIPPGAKIILRDAWLVQRFKPRAASVFKWISTRDEGEGPFEVVVSEQPPSAVLADQVNSLDWRARKAVHKGKVPVAALAEVQAKIGALLGL